MRNTLKKIAVTTGVASAALVLATTQAMAFPATTWTVSPNPAPFTAVSTNTVLAVNGIPMTCPTAAASGSAASATGNPAKVADITAASFGTTAAPCTSILGPVTPVTTMPWQIWAEDYNAGVTSGYIKNIQAKLTVLTCTFTVTGEVAGTFTNSSKVLSVSSNATRQLTVSGATSGCAGLVANGDHPTFTGDYAVTGITSIVGT
ncbi:hypothetical protein [Streptomyces sp. NPDC056452]|uniref:hypothetical protein n=1 Tax=Streptomyces sp. NPDC056452 TaxID=3345821 RepID=UPI0036C2AFDA